MTVWLTILAALGCGLIAGAFFVFSVAVMPAFRTLPPAEGARAMRAVNVVILNPIFLGVFIGTAVLSAALAVISILERDAPGSRFWLAGSLLYLVGSFLVTIAFNVPLNNSLALLDLETASGRQVWKNYLIAWTYWNHIRTIASAAALVLLVLSLIR